VTDRLTVNCLLTVASIAGGSLLGEGIDGMHGR
jgi:hypothetical protein